MGFISEAYEAFDAFFGDIGLSFLKGPVMALPIPLIAGCVYWLVRRIRQKKQFGGDFKELRRRCRFNEAIRALFVIWVFETAALTLVPVKAEIYVEEFLRRGTLSSASIPMFMFSPEHILSMVSHFFTSFSASEMLSLHTALNILFFAPFGLLAPFIWDKLNLWKTTLAGFVISLLIEFLQIFVLRVCELSDLISNTAGALAGYALFMLLKKLLPGFTEKCLTSAKTVIKI